MPQPPAASSRIAVFDGLRGIAIILVLVSHTAWLNWPHPRGEGNRIVRAVLENGNYAVSFFFVIGAFLYTRSLLARADSPEGLHPGVQLLRRYFRLTVSVAVLLVVAVLVKTVERTATYPDAALGESSWALLTYTWNWYVRENVMTARPDFGHLWYLSVDMQVFLLVLLLVFLLRGRRVWLLLTLSALLVAVIMWRAHVYQTEGVFQALLRTNARMDAPVAGATAAVALPYLSALKRQASVLAWSGLAALPLLALLTVDDVQFFRAPGALVNAALVAFVLGCSLAAPGPTMNRVLGNPVLAFLGRRSLSIYIWHFPVYMYLYHHTDTWPWQTVTILAAVIIVAVATANDLVIERQVDRFLRSSAWHRLDRGIPRYVAAMTAAARDNPAGQVPAGSVDDDTEASQELKASYVDEERSV